MTTAAASIEGAPQKAGIGNKTLFIFFMLCRYDAGVEIRVSRSSDAYNVDVTADPVRPMMLHWAVNEWQAPPQDSWPSGTNQVLQTIIDHAL